MLCAFPAEPPAPTPAEEGGEDFRRRRRRRRGRRRRCSAAASAGGAAATPAVEAAAAAAASGGDAEVHAARTLAARCGGGGGGAATLSRRWRLYGGQAAPTEWRTATCCSRAALRRRRPRRRQRRCALQASWPRDHARRSSRGLTRAPPLCRQSVRRPHETQALLGVARRWEACAAPTARGVATAPSGACSARGLGRGRRRRATRMQRCCARRRAHRVVPRTTSRASTAKCAVDGRLPLARDLEPPPPTTPLRRSSARAPAASRARSVGPPTGRRAVPLGHVVDSVCDGDRCAACCAPRAPRARGEAAAEARRRAIVLRATRLLGRAEPTSGLLPRTHRQVGDLLEAAEAAPSATCTRATT